MMMIYSNVLKELVNMRTFQVIVISLISMSLCQLLKFIVFSIKEKKFMFKTLITTGGFPSSHTSCVTSLVISIGLFQFHDSGELTYSFAIALVFATIVIHDAMGVRLEASKHAKILNNLVSNEDMETKQKLGFGKKGHLKELLGHKGFEVLGGFLLGVLVAIVGYLIAII